MIGEDEEGLMDASTMLGTLAVVLGSASATAPTARAMFAAPSVFDAPSAPFRLSARAHTPALALPTWTPRRPAVNAPADAPPRILLFRNPLVPSIHRDNEGGAVILEMGPHGTQPLHCHGHWFPIKH